MNNITIMDAMNTITMMVNCILSFIHCYSCYIHVFCAPLVIYRPYIPLSLLQCTLVLQVVMSVCTCI